jgi:ribosome-binding protein aMBF1 (putative translation factor)
LHLQCFGGWPATELFSVDSVDSVEENNLPPVDIAARFGDNLARARKQADLSQDELSVRASVHRTEISQLERGLRIARIDTLVKLAGSLEVSPEELLAGMSWDPGGTRIGKFRSADEQGG